MKTVTLIIKEKYLAEIIAGTKKIEYREIRPNSNNKYLVYLPGDNVEPRQYDTITFYAGYTKNRKSAIVEITDSEIVIEADENNVPIEYEEKGIMYTMATMQYTLGKVISHNFN